MGDFITLENRQGLLQQSSSYTVYLPLFSSCIIVIYVTVYILRYYCWRVKQRRRKVRLLEYEKLRWLWHQKQAQLHYHIKEEKAKVDIDGEQGDAHAEKYPYTRSSSSSSSVTSINESKHENNAKMKAKQHQQQQKKCDYGDDSTHCRESSLIVTIPSPAYQPSHDHHSPSTKPRLPNSKTTTQLHHYHLQHQHQHQHSSTSSASSSSSSTRKAPSHGHQGSFYSSSSSTTTLACCTQQHRCKKEHHHLPEASPCLTSSPTTLSFSNPTSPSSSLKETPSLFYPNQEEKEDTRSRQDNRSQAHALASFFEKKKTSSTLIVASTPATPKVTHSSKSRQTYWPLYDTKAKRTRMIWKWSVAMGYCHYDHAKVITSIIEQLDPPPSHRLC